MFGLKRKFRRIDEIDELRARIKALEHHEIRSALLDKTNLPPCISEKCYSCKHIAYATGTHGGVWLLGCGKGLECGDYEPHDEYLKVISEKNLKAAIENQIQN